MAYLARYCEKRDRRNASVSISSFLAYHYELWRQRKCGKFGRHCKGRLLECECLAYVPIGDGSATSE